MYQKKEMKTVWIGEMAPTPLGPLWAAMSEDGLWAVEYGVPREEFEERVLRRGQVRVVYDRERVAGALQQLMDFLEGKRRNFDLPIDWSNMTDFQIRVRQAVMSIPFGDTCSYGEIAVQVGQPGGARAVGRVQATNPISFVIPCHRVIGADGSLHGYGGAGGLKTKAWLLELEK